MRQDRARARTREQEQLSAALKEALGTNIVGNSSRLVSFCLHNSCEISLERNARGAL